ncbi:hypothetical protein I6F51_13775 [Salmonella enterica subsp. enterica serovar Typhi]|nr:hypothetical protein [Salmonella enterica subsp. enterica serovar Typhi]
MVSGRVQALLEQLRAQGIRDEQVLNALAAVPREKFIDEAFEHKAWENIALPIGQGQTISQPYMVARMTELLELTPQSRVLEIGTGSGYQTAILAHLVHHVCSVERIKGLHFLKAICSTLATVEGWSGLATHPVVQAINFVGSPVIALAISVLLAVYTLVPRMDKHTTAERLEEGLQSAGIILLVTGAGGALGAILRDSGAGQQLAEQVANLPISPILIPFIVATLVRLIQGSGTVAMITAASISAPILAQIPGINMLLAAQAATMGSLFFGYFNDSLFWVVNRMMGVSDVKQQMVVWSVPTTIAWAIGGTGVALINLLFGSGGSWLDPLLPIVVLAAIMLWVRWQAQGIKDKLVVKD